MPTEKSWGHAIRLLEPEEIGGECIMGRRGRGTGCDRPPVYLISWRARSGAGGAEAHTQVPACVSHVGNFARNHGVEIPRPVHVVVRRRDGEQQVRDVLARLVREHRAMRRDQAEFFERLAGLFSMASPSQRRLPLGMAAGEHRQQLWGDVREGMTG